MSISLRLAELEDDLAEYSKWLDEADKGGNTAEAEEYQGEINRITAEMDALQKKLYSKGA